MKTKITVAAILTVICLLGGCAEKERTIIIDGGVSNAQSEVDSSSGSSSELSDSSGESPVMSTTPTQTSSPLSESTPVSSVSSSDVESSESDISENSSSSSTTSSSSTRSESSSSVSSSSSSKPIIVTPYPPSGTNSYKPLNYSEVRGVWISYIEIAVMQSGSESAFRSSIGAAYDNCVSLGLNTVYVHVRSHGDAYYNSDYFPKTKYINGGFDALKIMVEEAHKRGLSFQAWINPFRVCLVSEIEREKGYPIYNWRNDNRLVQVGNLYYLNPAYNEVISLIADGAREIVANYDVDGLHIDDYFYPTTDASFDSAEFQSSSYNTLSEFRMSNCDKLVSSLYSAVKSANSNALFGVSCQGSLENNYNDMYADVKKWCYNYGYTDYIMPQIYYGFSNSTQPYSTCVNTWNNIAQNGKIPLIVGLSVSKIGLEDKWAGAGKDEWITDSDILKRQFSEAYELSAYGGVCLYSYNSVFNPEGAVKSQVDREIKALKTVMR